MINGGLNYLFFFLTELESKVDRKIGKLTVHYIIIHVYIFSKPFEAVA